MNFKFKVYQQYLILINEKILSLQKILDELSDSAKNETKSTAGDKHETALAMLQIEQENTHKNILMQQNKNYNWKKLIFLNTTEKLLKEV